MTSLHCYGDSDFDKIHRTRNVGLSLAAVWISIPCIMFLLRCDLYCDTLKSFTFFIFVKTITMQNLEHMDKSEINILKKWPSGFTCSMHRTWLFYVLVWRRTKKKSTKNYNAVVSVVVFLKLPI